MPPVFRTGIWAEAEILHDMPLTSKGKKILNAMKKDYGAKKGERVFYASVNAGKIRGAEVRGRPRKKLISIRDIAERLKKK